MRIKNILIAVIFLLFLPNICGSVRIFAQNVGINTTGNAPNSSALLDINASPGNNKGILIPRLPLTATNNGTPISPLPGVAETGLMVFNTATAGVSPNDVVPGFYYWNGTAWAPMGAGGSTAGGWTDDGTVVRLTTGTDFVGIGTASPAATAALDITSTTKGILIPRMTTAQRDAIITPASGLQVYNTDCQSLNYWSGTCWISTSKALPSPDPITSTPATTVFCAGQVRTYSIPVVPGATKYGWTVPAGTSITSGQGTTSISATFGNLSGSVCVDASNSCETSPPRCLSVSVDPIPNTPGNITGVTSINPGQTSVTYFVASVNGASTYTWSVPAGATITSGTGTTTIVVNFACNASSGNISVTANSTCGSSPASALALTITPLLAANAGSNISGPATIGGSPAASGGTAGYTYAWSPTSGLSGSTAANPTATACTTTTYTLIVTDSRSCTATSSITVTKNLVASAGANLTGPGTIGGAPTATGGNNATYSYSWSPTTDLVSSTVANPTAKACTTTTYTVTVTDANSCTAVSSGVTVTKNLVASAGANLTMGSGGCRSIGGSPTATGGNGSYTYSWNPTTSLSSSTIGNPFTTVSSTTTYTVTVTDGYSCSSTSSMTLTTAAATVTTFTSSTTWTAPAGVSCVQVLVVAGGGSGGNHSTSNGNGGGGGGGVIYNTSYAVTPGNVYTVTVGAGGTAIANSTSAAGNNGANSVFGTLTAIGGGGGGSTGAGMPGKNGGSGGGSCGDRYEPGVSTQTGGFGNSGGNGAGTLQPGGGGGGAGGAGVASSGQSAPSGNGGAGYACAISGSTLYYAGGGGGGGNSSERAGDGYHGGGRGCGSTTYYAYNSYPGGINGTTLGSGYPTAIVNTGGGGGGGSYWASNGGWGSGSGAGGSGIVIIKY
ncbi:MAG: hypothetical protein V4547_06105 [Bacteroidota bacterium]